MQLIQNSFISFSLFQQRGVSMPKYVLTYFNFRARAELPRLIFAVAGEEFEDKRITKIEEWLEMKPSEYTNCRSFSLRSNACETVL